jgi:hypothetical protein
MPLRVPESADLGGALEKFIDANYTDEEYPSVNKSIIDVQALRARMVRSVARNASERDHASTLATLLSYYKVLACLTARFPFQSASGLAGPPASAFADDEKVTFTTTWFDGFAWDGSRVSDTDVAFEKYSVLFNIANLFSHQAAQIHSALMHTDETLQAAASSDSSLKEACRLFQVSSGLFESLARAPEIVGGTLANGASLDLNPEALGMLSVLMLAQAAACFFEKSTTTASPKLVAKLSMGVSQLFQDAYTRCEKNGRLPKLVAEYFSRYCVHRMLCYEAASHYWFAKGVLAEEREYGLGIAHLERARMILGQPRKHETGPFKKFEALRINLDQALVTRLQMAIKDNDASVDVSSACA